jgi:uncharacterized protein (TIGR02145 family)
MKTVKIGNQNWTDHNLVVTSYNNGDSIPLAKNNTEWVDFNKRKEGCYCFFDNDDTNASKGLFYNGYAVIDSRGIAPIGFSIPTSDDFEELIEFVNSQEGGLLNLLNKVGWDEHFVGTELYELNALPCGLVSVDMKFMSKDDRLALWTSSKVEKYLTGYELSTYVDDEEEEVSFSSYNYDIRYGFNLRLIKK